MKAAYAEWMNERQGFSNRTCAYRWPIICTGFEALVVGAKISYRIRPLFGPLESMPKMFKGSRKLCFVHERKCMMYDV